MYISLVKYTILWYEGLSDSLVAICSSSLFLCINLALSSLVGTPSSILCFPLHIWSTIPHVPIMLSWLCVYTMLHAHIIWYGSGQLQIRKNMGYSFLNVWIASINIFFLMFTQLFVMLLITVTLHINGILWYICTTFSSSVCLLGYIYVISISWLLWIGCLWTLLSKYLWGRISSSLEIVPGWEILGYTQ